MPRRWQKRRSCWRILEKRKKEKEKELLAPTVYMFSAYCCMSIYIYIQYVLILPRVLSMPRRRQTKAELLAPATPLLLAFLS
jgi:hypothetical protein